jgi:excisionase family DNA binding protein
MTEATPHRALMTTREVADYLRLKERKVYDLVRDRRIPCIRLTGKWLFPRTLIELWVLQNAEGVQPLNVAVERPPVIAGSHDPLLEWAAREAECDLAFMFNGSLDGLNRFAQGKARCCGLHVFDPDTGEYNRGLAARTLAGCEVVLIQWAWREQGLGIAAVARQCRLDFVPLHRERYDLVIGRRDYFEPSFQQLLGFSRTARFAEKAAELGGYDVSGLGRVIYNGP